MKRVLVAAAALVACASACDSSSQSHVYVASLFEPTGGCFDSSTSLGTIATPDGDLGCAPTCLVYATKAGSKVYMSTMCGPYPAGADVSQTDPGCAAAFAAWATPGNGPNSCANASSSDASVDGMAGDAAASDGGSDDGGASGEGATDDGSGSSDADEGGAPGDAPAG